MLGGTAEAAEILRSRDLAVVAGAIGYWVFDNAVLYATFQPVGADVPTDPGPLTTADRAPRGGR